MFHIIQDLQKLAKDSYPKLKYSATELFFNIKKTFFSERNLLESNINLGITHIQNNNIDDAIFRFKIIDRFFDRNNKDANYWLGWCYIMKQNFEKAIIHLTIAEDNTNLIEFIENIDKTTHVPTNIYYFYRNINPLLFINKFASKTINTPREMVKKFLQIADDLPTSYKVLELGSNIGILSEEIKGRLQGDFSLTATEGAERILELKQELYPEKNFYNQLYNFTPEEFLNKNTEKYHVIFNLDSTANEQNLDQFHKLVYKNLEKNGYYVFTVKTSDETALSYNLLEFSYNINEIEATLNKNKLLILASDQIILENKNKYTIFVCKK